MLLPERAALGQPLSQGGPCPGLIYTLIIAVEGAVRGQPCDSEVLGDDFTTEVTGNE